MKLTFSRTVERRAAFSDCSAVVAGAGRAAGGEQGGAEQAAQSEAINRPQAELGRQAYAQPIGHSIP